ncbi:MAG TPA: chromate efflux transporter [Candidatus Hydrogenedentes bacterium]|nr:chromate efflux transporter [Candidatus Hydrogenedentota bacterium]
MSNDHASVDLAAAPSFGEAVRTWAYIGINSFGGPAGQIAVMHRVLVEEKKWVSEERFLHALNYCMLLPGPEAQQLATYVGWLLHGTRGGIVAGTLFVLPGMAAIMLLSNLYAGFNDVSWVQSVFFGLKSAILAVVVEALLRIGRRALKSGFQFAVAALAFIALFFFAIPFPLIIVSAALLGLLQLRLSGGMAHRATANPIASEESGDGERRGRRPSLLRSFAVCAGWGMVWFSPLLAIALFVGPESVYFKLGTFFSKAAVVTFGGAYSVLAYIAQEAVQTFGWLRPGEMMDGLAMAETTPGPLIMVLQFVGFMAAYREPGALHPMVAGTLGGLLTTWVTFAPCFLWIFLGAPYIEVLRGNRRLTAALSSVTAAVVGVILNLSVWFAVHVLFGQVSELNIGVVRLLNPDWSTFSPIAAILVMVAMIATFRFHVGMLKVLAGCAILGVLARLILPGT